MRAAAVRGVLVAAAAGAVRPRADVGPRHVAVGVAAAVVAVVAAQSAALRELARAVDAQHTQRGHAAHVLAHCWPCGLAHLAGL